MCGFFRKKIEVEKNRGTQLWKKEAEHDERGEEAVGLRQREKLVSYDGA